VRCRERKEASSREKRCRENRNRKQKVREEERVACGPKTETEKRWGGV
jgi:hypothetical protein